MGKPRITIGERRSKVRVLVTYFAAGFLFFGGALFIGAMVVIEEYDIAKELFTTILPISASIVAYWFGTRGVRSSNDTMTKAIRKNPEGSTRITSSRSYT